MPWLIIFIVGGIVLRANEEWFNGADTVGTILLAFGIAGAALLCLLFLFVAMFGASR